MAECFVSIEGIDSVYLSDTYRREFDSRQDALEGVCEQLIVEHRQVFELWSKGHTNNEMAKLLHVPLRRVERLRAQLRTILHKWADEQRTTNDERRTTNDERLFPQSIECYVNSVENKSLWRCRPENGVCV
ncbi:MAG: hypothetical protein ABL921_00825 [Pirellula sp.]